MIGCLWTHVGKQPIIALYFEFETVLKFYNLWARLDKLGMLFPHPSINSIFISFGLAPAEISMSSGTFPATAADIRLEIRS